MATIRNRSGVWQAQIRKHGHHVPSKSFAKKTDAEVWARKIESEIERGVFLDLTQAQQTSIAQALERYAFEVLPTKLAIASEQSRIKHLKKGFGKFTLANINSSAVSSYRNQRLEQVAPQTVKHEISLLSRVFNVAIKEWGINLPHGNPVARVSMPKLPSGRSRRLELNEESKLLSELANNPVMRAIVVLALETAMRRGEIAHLQPADIQLSSKTLHIPHSKNGLSRTIPLSTRALSAVEGLPGLDVGPVFGLQSGSISQAFDRSCKRVGIEDLRFHDLRHEATSRLFEKGFSVMEVATITGHQDIRMLRRYTHIRAEHLAEKMN